MNFKRNLLIISTVLVGALSLSGCGKSGDFRHFEYINEKEDKHEDIIKDGYSKFGNYNNYVVSDTKGGEVDLGSAYEVFRDYSGASYIPSIGEQKIIVVPVAFPDYGIDKLNLTAKEYVEDIKKAFFGCPENNEYVSVAEYFNKSSYGKLKLNGKVCDKVYTFPLSTSAIKERKLKRDTLASEYYKKVVDWYKDNYDDIEDYQVEGLKTGKNVPIYMVYTYPSEEKSETDPENFFWAYTFSETPLSWSSYSFMNLVLGQPDAHTYIHETGHLLGLNDYYPTIEPEEEDLRIEPTSRIDMMDSSVGDETAFSKMYLNWTRPYYITDSCEITINSFTDTGDLILIANDWNKTVFDEYFLIEFYTPTGLNTYDVSIGNSLAKLPKVPGIKVYHVDARLGYLSSNRTVVDYCSNGQIAPTENNIGFAHDNNTYDTPNEFQKNYLYQLMLNNAIGIQNTCATDANLFRLGDKLPILRTNDEKQISIKITIEDLKFDKVTLKFEKGIKVEN